MRQMKTIIEEMNAEHGDTERIHADSNLINAIPSSEVIRSSQSTPSNIDSSENIENLSNSFKLVAIKDILIASKCVGENKLKKLTTLFDSVDSMIGKKKSKKQRLTQAKLKQKNIKSNSHKLVDTSDTLITPKRVHLSKLSKHIIPFDSVDSMIGENKPKTQRSVNTKIKENNVNHIIIEKTSKQHEVRKSTNIFNIPETVILDSDDETQIYTIESITKLPSNTTAFHNAHMNKKNNNTSLKNSSNMAPITHKTNVKNLKITETMLTTVESDDETPDIYTSRQHTVINKQLDHYSNTNFSNIVKSTKEIRNESETQITAIDNEIDTATMLPFESIIESQVTQLTDNRNSPSILTGFREIYNAAAITENEILDDQPAVRNKPDKDIEQNPEITNTYNKPIIYLNDNTHVTLSNGQATITRALGANVTNIGQIERTGVKVNQGSSQPLRTINMTQLSNERGTENTTMNYTNSFVNAAKTAHVEQDNKAPVMIEKKDVNTTGTIKNIEDSITSYVVINNKQVVDNLNFHNPRITNVCYTDTSETNLNIISQKTMPNSMNSIPDSQQINPDPDTHAKLLKCLVQPINSKITKRNRTSKTNRKPRSKSNVNTQNKELLGSISSKTNSCKQKILSRYGRVNAIQEPSWIENIKFIRCIDPDEYLPIELSDAFWRENITFPGLKDEDFSL